MREEGREGETKWPHFENEKKKALWVLAYNNMRRNSVTTPNENIFSYRFANLCAVTWKAKSLWIAIWKAAPSEHHPYLQAFQSCIFYLADLLCCLIYRRGRHAWVVDKPLTAVRRSQADKSSSLHCAKIKGAFDPLLIRFSPLNCDRRLHNSHSGHWETLSGPSTTMQIHPSGWAVESKGAFKPWKELTIVNGHARSSHPEPIRLHWQPYRKI